MIIGCLVLGFLGAIASAALALLSGFGLLAAFGFYALGGSVVTLVVACASLWLRPAGTTDIRAAKA